MRINDAIKKITGSFAIFLSAFVIISLAADISFLSRKTTPYRGEAGWEGMPDFKVYWLAGNVMADKTLGREENGPSVRKLYDKEEKFYHFRYSPVAALFMAPFGKIPFPRLAMAAWLLLGNALVLFALLILSGHIKERFSLGEAEKTVMLWLMFLGTLRYYLVVICQGQTDGMVMFLLVLLFVAYIGRKEVFSGILLAMILQMKPFFGVLLIFFILEKRYRIVAAWAIAMLALAIIPAAFVGVRETANLNKEWLEMMGMSVPSQVLNYKNQSFSYALAVGALRLAGESMVLSPESLVAFFSVLLLGISLCFFFVRREELKIKSPIFYEYLVVSFFAATTVVFSPISWEAYYMFLVIPLALIFAMGVYAGKIKELIFYVAGYFVITLSSGTDITKFVPGIGDFRYINISLGTAFLFYGIFSIYRALPGSGKSASSQLFRERVSG